MILTFLGADHEVTGSCHYIEVGEKKAIIDCGMEQGKDIYVNQELPVMAGEIDYIRPFRINTTHGKERV